jgi:LacI family transcriptional regulator
MAAKISDHSRNALVATRVAVLVDTSTTWGRDIIKGVHTYSRTHGGWHLFLEARGHEEMMKLPGGWHGEGIIARIGALPLARHLKRTRLPVVNVSGIQLNGPTFPRVTNDVEAVARLALDYYLDRGFKHFAYLSLRGLEYVTRQRDAFVKLVAGMGFKCAVHSVRAHIGFQSPHWNLKVDELGAWLKSLPKPVALFTWSGGREVIHACQHMGLRVPEEISVLNGSEDELLGEFSPVPVSGIQAAGRKMGFEAASLLDRLMHGGSDLPQAMLIPPISVVTRQSTDTMALNDRALISALGFIRENKSRPFQVRDVALRAGISRRMLERRFLQSMGRSPAAYIGKVRLDHVKTLLAETDLPINEIAEHCGFCSPEYMTSVFSKEVHTTPLRYRREVLRR